MRNLYKMMILALALALPAAAFGATLNVVATTSPVMMRQPVRIDIAFDTQGDTANAVQGDINFPASQFSLDSVNDGGSPVSFWINPPAETSSGTVSFAGIMPNGFQGSASSVVSLWLVPTAPGSATISLSNVQLLRNDGQGTAIDVTTNPAVLSISNAVATGSVSLPSSLVPPESFTPIVSKDPNIYDGRYFLAFSTTDKGSGIDHYEVMEVPTVAGTGVESVWHVATSPYLLEDQSLSSTIFVRAVDHAGNFIVVEVPAEHPGSGRFVWTGLEILLIILLLVLALEIVVIVRRKRGS